MQTNRREYARAIRSWFPLVLLGRCKLPTVPRTLLACLVWGWMLTGLIGLPVYAQSFERLAPNSYKSGSIVRSAFRDVVADARAATVRIFCDGKVRAFGTVVDKDGWILTKSSELSDPILCRLCDGRKLDAHIVSIDGDHDLALLKVDAADLTPVHWVESVKIDVGQWLAVPGLTEDPLAVGVVSVATREIPKQRPLLGVGLDDAEGGGVRVSQVLPLSAAAKAGVKVDDVITHLDEKSINARMELIDSIQEHRSGDVVHLRILRDEETINVEATLGTWGFAEADMPSFVMGGLSSRRYGFPQVIQHDSILKPDECGGPVVNLEGKVVGINIARAGRTASYALPSTEVISLLHDMKTHHVAYGDRDGTAEEEPTEM